MFTRVCPQPPHGGCYSNLSWPSCDPNGESVLACADVAPRDVYDNLISDDVTQPCCLTGETVQDFHDTICPTGWTTTPDEYCTSQAVDILYGPHYRYKCHRTCTT